MVINEVEQFKNNLRLYINIFSGLVALFFTSLHIYNSDYYDAIASTFGFIYFALVIFLLYRKGYYFWNGRGYAIVISLILLNTSYYHPEFGVYWAFVGVISMFFITDLRAATIGSIIFLGFNLSFVRGYYPSEIMLRVYCTLILVFIISFLTAYLIEKLFNQLNFLVTRDPLTKALNRHCFNSSMDITLKTFIRYGTPTSLIMLDLDFFKKINDTYGHIKGDQVLKEFTSTIQQRLRDTDLLFRYGGEEFAIILNQTKKQDAIILAEELRKLVDTHQFLVPSHITISIGGTEIKKADDATSWLDRCDIALYEAKSTGRNKTIFV